MKELSNQVAETGCFGYVSLIGRPNVGKSTLLNQIIGKKVSIVTRKPQTTRQRIAGILSRECGQIVFLDTPGIHSDQARAINRYMNRCSLALIHDSDLVLVIVDATGLRNEDLQVIEHVHRAGAQALVVLNKLDLVEDRTQLLPLMEQMGTRLPDASCIPVSALKRDGVDTLLQEVVKRLPMCRPLYDEREITDRSEQFMAAELVRESVMLRYHREIPYSSTVAIESFTREGALLRIDAVILVERESQKPIVIGKGGAALKQVGHEARLNMEALFGGKVFLKLWVKVMKNWSDSEIALNRLGFVD